MMLCSLAAQAVVVGDGQSSFVGADPWSQGWSHCWREGHWWSRYRGKFCLDVTLKLPLDVAFALSNWCLYLTMPVLKMSSFWSVCFNILLASVLSALTLLVRRQEEHPACKNWVMRCWRCYLSRESCRLFAYAPTNATVIPKPCRLSCH